MTIRPAAFPLEGPLDIARTFGPMAAMHAALDQAGAGMPCGLVARFRGRTAGQVQAGIAAAAARFPVLQSRFAWVGSRPALLPAEACSTLAGASQISLTFKADPGSPPWRYALRREGQDVWLTAVWAHAVADGRSMLHFLRTVSALIDDRDPPVRAAEPGRPKTVAPLAAWLPRFLIERHLTYVKPAADALESPGVSWITLPASSAGAALDRARSAECGFAAWLAAAACMAFSEQQRGERSGSVSLNLLASVGDLAALGGFGFAAGSLLLPVKLAPDITLESVARNVFGRQRAMLAQGWDENLERFIGEDPGRHRLFATLEARGLSAPTISVSWKGLYPELGQGGSVSDVACFAAAKVAHVSAHVDANGLSISVASQLPGHDRKDLLRRIAALVGDRLAARLFSLDELAMDRERPDHRVKSPPPGPAVRV